MTKLVGCQALLTGGRGRSVEPRNPSAAICAAPRRSWSGKSRSSGALADQCAVEFGGQKPDAGQHQTDLADGCAGEPAGGPFGDGLKWTIIAAGEDQNFSTMLNIYRGDKLLSGSGMGGPKLYGSDVMNYAYGHSDDVPVHAVVRVDPSVDQVVATTSAGTEIVLAMSEVNAEFGLRFGAALLPEGEELSEVRAVIGNRTVQTRPHLMDRKSHFSGPDDKFGWRPTDT